MFGKKSNITNQRRMKEDMLKDLNALLYQLEKGKFNSALDCEAVLAIGKDIRKAYQSVENSLGTGDEDITLGCAKIRKDIVELGKAAQGNLLGRIEDIALSLIEDLNEIVDLENGMIAEIATEAESASRKQKYYNSKLLEIESIEQEFVIHRNRVEADIAKLERDKAELDGKLLAEGNPRLKQTIFRQIKATLNNIATLHTKSNQYSSCFNLLDSIRIYAKELVETGDLSSIELDKAKIILNINRIRYVLDDPTKLQPLLNAIENDLKKTKAKTELRDGQLNHADALGGDSYEEMNDYQNTLIKDKADKEAITADVIDLETDLKKNKDR